MFEKFRPLGDRVLIKRLELDQAATTAGGIIIPDTAKEKAQTAEVIAVGTGRVDNNGKTIGMAVKVGDIVYVGKYSGTEAGRDFAIVREEEILGIVEKS